MSYFADWPPEIFYPFVLFPAIALYLWGGAAVIEWWLRHAPGRTKR